MMLSLPLPTFKISPPVPGPRAFSAGDGSTGAAGCLEDDMRNCEHCGAEFDPPRPGPSRPSRFCSPGCVHAWMVRAVVKNYRIRDEVRVHRTAAQIMLGRALLPGEIVHHKNGDIFDNRHENLAVMTQAEHARLHANERARKLGATPGITKICRVCKMVKPLSEFSPSSSHGKKSHSSQCKPCAAELQRARRTKHAMDDRSDFLAALRLAQRLSRK